VVEPTGAETHVSCRHQGTDLAVVFRDRHAFEPGSTIHLQPDLLHAHLFDAKSASGWSPRAACLEATPSDGQSTSDLNLDPNPKEMSMQDQNRRKFLESSAGVAAAATLGVGTLWTPQTQAQTLAYKPETGAKLRVLRWKRFVQGDEDAFMVNIKKFSDQYGVEVRVDNEGWEDVRPKAAVAANVGSGPDIIIGWFDDPHQYPDKLIDMTDLADYLGKKYGGWYDVCKKYAQRQGTNNWISIPWGIVGNAIVYRESHVKAAGFDGIPKDTAGFLKLCQAMSAKGTQPGFALARRWATATTGCTGCCGRTAARWSTRPATW